MSAVRLAGPELAERLAALVGEERVESAGGGPPVAVPASEAELAELVRFAGREGLRALPIGLGSKLGRLPPLAGRFDLALSTRGLAGVTSFEPEDGTLRARAGTAMADLAGAARAGGLWLSPDVARPERATLGGVVAAGESGVDRLRCGPVRHNVLGARVLLADGTTASCGGQLVKNVTGYDLHRLWCGSFGTLCVILDAALRLYALPDEERALTAELPTVEAAFAAARAIAERPLRPLALAVEVDAAAGGARLTALLAGRGPVVAAEARALAEALPDATETSGEEASARRRELRDAAADPGGAGALLAATALPSRAVGALAAGIGAARAAGVATRAIAHPAIASLALALDTTDAGALRAVERAVSAAGARASWRAAPEELRAELSPLRAEPARRAWMRRLRAALDPAGTFGGEALLGGIG